MEDHEMQAEWFSLDEGTVSRLNQAKREGKKIIAVGTTTTRVLESCVADDGQLVAKEERRIFLFIRHTNLNLSTICLPISICPKAPC